MAAKKCLICNCAFHGRADAKTCSPRCRKRLQQVRFALGGADYGQRNQKAAAKVVAQDVEPAPAVSAFIQSDTKLDNQIKTGARGEGLGASKPDTSNQKLGTSSRTGKGRKLLSLILLGLFGFISVLLSATPQKANAITASTNLNFQARLLNASGAVVPDGVYNIDFKIYNTNGTTGTVGTCTGACLWEETRKVFNTQGVTVTNGYFSVNLGSVTAFPSTINWQQQLYLTMNITTNGTQATNPISTDWNGEMLNSGNSVALTSVPLAFRANQLSVVNNNFDQVLQFATGSFAQATTISLPDPGASTATVCYQNASACGFALSSGSGNYIQNSTGGPQAANFNIISSAAGNTSTIHAHASQSVDIFDINNNTSTVYLGVSSNGSLSVSPATAGTITLGTTSQTGAINVGQAQTSNQTVNIESAAGTASTQTVEIGGGTSTTSGGKVVNIANGTPGASTTNTIAIGTGGSTTGTVGITIGSATAAGHTLLLQGGNGTIAGTAAVRIQANPVGDIQIGAPSTSGVVSIGGSSQTGTITLGQYGGSGTSIINIGASAGATTTQQINIGSSATGINTLTIGSTSSSSGTTIKAGSTGLSLNAATTTATGNLVVQGTTGLTFNTGAGGDITFANNEKISNDTNGQINLSADSGALTLLLTGTAATIQNSAGALSITAAGALNLASSAAGAIAINPNGAGGLNLGTTGTGTITIGNSSSTALKLGKFGTANGILYISATDGTVSETAASTGTQCLQTASAGVAPTWGSCGSVSTLAASYTAGSSSTDQTLLLTTADGGGVILKDASTTVGNLFTVQNNAATLNYLNVTSSTVSVNDDLNVGTISNVGAAGRLLSDGFESGNFKQWAYSSGSITADSTLKRNGKYSANINLTAGTGFAGQNIKSSTTLSQRAYVYVTSQTNDLDFLNCSYSGDGSHNMAGIYRDTATGKLSITYSNATGNHISVGSTVMSTAAWHEIELVTTVNATTGSETLYLDGTSVATLSGIDSGSVGFDNCQIGETSNRTGNFNVDDVVVDTVRPGDSASLNLNDSLHVSGSTSLGGNLLVQAASDTTAAFQVQNATGTSILSVDATNSQLNVQGSTSVATLSAEQLTQAPPTNNFSVGPGTYWTLGTGWGSATTTAVTATSATGNLVTTAADLTVSTNTTYLISYNIGSYSGTGTVKPYIGGVGGVYSQGNGSRSSVITTAGATTQLTFTPSGSFSGIISNVSVKKVTISTPVVKINNSDASVGLEIRSGGSSKFNTFIGVDSGRSSTGTNNTAVGYQTLMNNVSGVQNTAVGTTALYNNSTGSWNTAYGFQAMYYNTTGQENTAFGLNALEVNTSGSANVAIGLNALQNSNADENTAVGYNSQYSNSSSTGTGNTSVGRSSLFNNNLGSNNTAIGNYALSNVDGTGNTSIGFQAGNNISSGTNNTFVGYNSGYQDPSVTTFRTLSGLQNATAIGYSAQVQQSNSIVLGGIGTIASNITPNIGIGTTAPSDLFSVSPDVYDTGTAYQDNGSAGVAGTTIHGTGTTWTANMIGSEFIFATGEKETITGFTNATTLTGSVSQAVGLVGSQKAYRIHFPLFQVDATNLRIAVGAAGTQTGQLYVGGSIPTSAVSTTSTGASTSPNQVAVQGRYAFVVNFNTSANPTLVIYDTTNPASPTSIYSGTLGGALTNPYTIAVSGKYAYIGIANGGNGIKVVDISNPFAPVLVGSAATGTEAHSIYVQGRYLYLATFTGATFEIYDIANPSNPVRLSSIATGGTNDTVYVQGDYAYVTSFGGSKLFIYDVSNPANPVLKNTGGTATNAGPRGISVVGRYAYIAAYTAGNVQVFDVKDPTTPSSVTTLGSNNPYSVVTQGQRLYISNNNANTTIDVMDITNPASLARVGLFTTGTNPNTIAVSGRYLYAPVSTGPSLQIFDIGGAYIQQFQAGGAELGTLQVDGNAQFASDVNIQGGTTIGQSLAVNGNLAIAGDNVVLNSGNTGEINGWTGTTSFGSAMFLGQTMVVNNYIYSIGGTAAQGALTVNYAPLNPDGTIGTWATTTSLSSIYADHLARTGLATWGNYIYLVGGETTAGNTKTTTVSYGKVNADGTISSWNTTTPLGTAMQDTQAVAYGGYLFAVGGNTGSDVTTVQSAKINSDGTLGPWVATNGLTTGTSRGGIAISGGYIYYLGGTQNGGTAAVTTTYYAQINKNGTTGTWTSSTGLPLARYQGAVYTLNGNLYFAGGFDGSAAVATVYYSAINPSTHAIGTWNTSAYPIPQITNAPQAAVNNGYLYELGGGVATNRFTSTARTKIGGSLDLVGAQGNGSDGGNLTAGNTKIIGSLEVMGQANIAQSLAVGGLVSTSAINVSGRTLTPATSTTVVNGSFNVSNMRVAGRYGYIANFSTDNKFWVYDLSNPNSPTLISSKVISTNCTSPDFVTLSGKYAYVVCGGNNNLAIIDITNPKSPTTLSVTQMPNVGYPTAPVVQGKYLYISLGGTSSTDSTGIYAYDVSNPLTPTKVGFYPTISSNMGLELFVQDKYLYVGSSNSTPANSKFFIFDANNINAGPLNGAGYALGNQVTNGTTLFGADSVYVQGRYAYVSIYGSSTLAIIDVSDPTAPAAAGSTTTNLSGPMGVNVNGKYAYVINSTNATLAQFDISNPASPVAVGSTVSTGTNPHGLQVSGRYAYVSNYGSGSFSVYDVGGSYIQQLEAGGIQASNLSIDGNSSFIGDISTQGGLTVGQSAQFQGSLSVNPATDNPSGFTVGDVTGSQVVKVSTVTAKNLLVEGNFESTSGANTGWARLQGGETSFGAVSDAGHAQYGNQSLKVVTSAISRDEGAAYLFPFKPNTTYTFSAYVSLAANAGATYGLGAKVNGSDVTCASGVGSGQTFTTTITRYTCTFTTTAVQPGNDYAYVRRGTGDANARTIYIDGAQLEQGSSATNYSEPGFSLSNLVANPSFEQGNTNGWNLGAGTSMSLVDNNTTGAQFGNSNLRFVSTATATDYIKFTAPLQPTTMYSLSMWIKANSAATAALGRQDVSGTPQNCTNISVTTSWQQFTCTFTTGSTITPPSGITLVSTGAAVRTFDIDGVTLVQANQGLAFANDADNIQVDSFLNNITLNGGNTGEIQPWKQSGNSLISGHSAIRSCVLNGYVYEIDNSGTEFAKLNADGSTGTWTAGTSPDVNLTTMQCVAMNGYLYVGGGNSGSTAVYSTKPNPVDGTWTSWQSVTPLPAIRGNNAMVGANGYIYDVGGYTSGAHNEVYYAKANADGTLGAWGQTTVLTQNTEQNTVVVANGCMYTIGGSDGVTAYATVKYAQINKDGTLGAWSSGTTYDLPALRAAPSAVVANGYVYVVGGSTTVADAQATNTVFYAKLNSNGSLGAWKTSAYPMPSARVYPSGVMSNGYIYMISGHNTAGASPTTVYYTSLPRISVNGTLDLVGLSGQSLTDAGDFSNGSQGGSLVAGNTQIVGSLQVAGQANIAQALAVGGLVSASGLNISGTVQSAPVSSYSTTATQDIKAQGNYLYGLTQSALLIWDNTKPNAFGSNLISSTTTNASSSVCGYSQGLAIAGKYAYINCETNTSPSSLVIYDISNPFRPILVSRIATGVSGTFSAGISVQGRYAYLSNLGTASTQIIDVSNPANPVIVGGVASSWGNAVQGNYLFTLDVSSTALVAYDVSNPASPVKVGSRALTGSASCAGGTVGSNNIVVQGRYAYVADCGNNDVEIFDISNPSSIPALTSVSTGAASLPWAVIVQGKNLYVGTNTGTLQTFDITSPTAPIQVSSITTPSSNNIYDMTVQGRYLYAGTITGTTFYAFDIGGAYIQQLESGDLQTTNLAVLGSAALAGSISAQGGLTVGQSAQFQGSLSVNPATDNPSGFTVGDVTGNQVVKVSTVATKNLLTDGSFEGSSVNNNAWTGYMAGTVDTLSTSTSAKVFGAQGLLDTTTATQYRGIKHKYAFEPNTTYTFSIYAAVASGSPTANLALGRQDAVYNTGGAGTSGVSSTTVTGSGTSWSGNVSVGDQIYFNDGQFATITNVGGNTTLTVSPAVNITGTGAVYEIEKATDCTAVTPTTTLTRYSCTFTTGAAPTYDGGVYARYTSATTAFNFYFDGAQLELGSNATNYSDPGFSLSNLVTNPSFETGTRTDGLWAQIGGGGNGVAVVDSNTTGAQFGNHSLKVGPLGTNGQGAGYINWAPSPNTQYSLSMWVKTASANTTAFTLAYDSGSGVNSCGSSFTPGTTWTQYTCTFSSGASIGANPYVFIKQTATAATPNIYIDGVTLVQASQGLAFANDGSSIQVDNLLDNITLNGGNNGEIQPWKANGNLLSASRTAAGRATANGYVYVIGGSSDGTNANAQNTTLYAELNADGTIGSWSSTSTLPSAIMFNSSNYANGYLYSMGGRNTSGTLQTAVYYAKVNSNGTIGSWQTNTSSLPAARDQGASVVANGYIYYLAGSNGGAQSTIYYAKLNADGTTGAFSTATGGAFNSRVSSTAVFANGYLYSIGGDSRISVQYTTLSSTGDTNAWSDATSLPNSNGSLTALVSNGYVYLIGGSDGASANGTYKTVWYAKMNNDGSLGNWNVSAYNLPVVRTNYAGINANGYMYVIGGGTNGTTSATSTIYYTSTARTLLSGSLDLVGLSGGTLADGGDTTGNTGGSLTAGNTKVVGTLEVAGQANFSQSIRVSGSLAVGGGATIQGIQSSGNILQVQNSGGINVVRSSTINLVGNSSFEGGITNTDNAVDGWSKKTGSETSLKNQTTAPQFGAQSLEIVTTTAASQGAKYAIGNLTPSTQYTLSFYAKLSTGSTSTLTFGRSDTGVSGGDTDCVTTGSISTTYARFNCTFTTGGTLGASGTPYIYVRKGSTDNATSRTIYIDGVQLETGAAATDYRNGDLTVDSLSVFKSTADSTTAFQIQSATGTAMFIVDTTNSKISLGAAGGTPVLLVLGNKNTSGDPTGTAGAIYYNSNTGAFRCYISAWANCASNASVAVSTTVSGLNTIFGGTPPNGAKGLIEAGNSPYTLLEMTYDSNYSKWVSQETTLAYGSSCSNNISANTWEDIDSSNCANGSNKKALIPYKTLTDAGLTLYLRVTAVMQSNGSASLDSGVQIVPYNINGSAGTASTDAALSGMNAFTSGTATLKDSGWASAPSFTAADFAAVSGRVRSNSNNTGSWNNFTIRYRWQN